jgi:hypothetical protein
MLLAHFLAQLLALLLAQLLTLLFAQIQVLLITQSLAQLLANFLAPGSAPHVRLASGHLIQIPYPQFVLPLGYISFS